MVYLTRIHIYFIPESKGSILFLKVKVLFYSKVYRIYRGDVVILTFLIQTKYLLIPNIISDIYLIDDTV